MFLQTALGVPTVVPAGQREGLADGAIGVGGDVSLFGWVWEARLGRNYVQGDVYLRQVEARCECQSRPCMSWAGDVKGATRKEVRLIQVQKQVRQPTQRLEIE